MNFSNWFKGYGSDNEVRAENEKLKREVSQLLIKLEVIESKHHQLYRDKNRYKEECARLEENIKDASYSLIKSKQNKELEMSTFHEEIARLKKLIALEKEAKESSGKVHTLESGMQVTDSLKRVLDANKEKIKGKGNDRTIK
jgi:hypothetical protein